MQLVRDIKTLGTRQSKKLFDTVPIHSATEIRRCRLSTTKMPEASLELPKLDCAPDDHKNRGVFQEEAKLLQLKQRSFLMNLGV